MTIVLAASVSFLVGYFFGASLAAASMADDLADLEQQRIRIELSRNGPPLDVDPDRRTMAATLLGIHVDSLVDKTTRRRAKWWQ